MFSFANICQQLIHYKISSIGSCGSVINHFKDNHYLNTREYMGRIQCRTINGSIWHWLLVVGCSTNHRIMVVGAFELNTAWKSANYLIIQFYEPIHFHLSFYTPASLLINYKEGSTASMHLKNWRLYVKSNVRTWCIYLHGRVIEADIAITC